MKQAITSVRHFLQEGIWQMDLRGLTPWRRLLLEIVKKLLLTIRFFTTKRVVSQASALTYSTLLAVVPVVAVVFAVGRGFGYNKIIETWFRDALDSHSQVADVVIGFVNSYLANTKNGLFLGVGLLLMLYTVLMLVRNIEEAFNWIWQVKKRRSFFRTFTDYLAIFLLLPFIIIVMSGLSLFVKDTTHSISEGGIGDSILQVCIVISPYLVLSALFVALYVFMPNTHVKLRSAIVPGILAGVSMQLFQQFYITSQAAVSSYNAIYGSFAALPLFMLWIQISWTICLFGAELCYMNQNLDYHDHSTQTTDISHRYRMMLSAMIMAPICRRFEQGLRPYNAAELSEQTGIPTRIVSDLIFKMIEARLIVETASDEKGEDTRYMPAESIERLSFGTMIDRLEAEGEWRLNICTDKMNKEEWRKMLEMRSDYLRKCRTVLLKDM